MLSFLRRLLSDSQPAVRRECRHNYRPQVEVLEDRRLLSLFAEFHVNQTTVGNQFDSDNASDRLGRTAFVWVEQTSDADDSNIRLRTFDAGVPGVVDPTFAPNPLTNEVLVDNNALNDAQPAVSMARQNGTLVVVWARETTPGNRDILGRHFNVNGAALSNVFFVANTAADEFEPDVAVSPLTGEFIVTYTIRISSNNLNVLAKRFGPLGTIPQQTINVGVQPTLNEQHSSVAFSQSALTQFGTFAVAYQETALSTPNNHNIRLKRFNENGTFVGSHLVAGTTLREENPSVAGDPNGGFLVAWQRLDGGTNWNVFSRRVTSSGVLGGVITVSASATAHEINPAIGVDPISGNFAVGYQFVQPPQPFNGVKTLRIKVTEFLASNARRLTVDVGSEVIVNFVTLVTNGLNIFGPAVSFGGGAYNVSYTRDDHPTDIDFGIFARRGRIF